MKRVLRYEKGTLAFGILSIRSKDPRLSKYANSDWVGSIADRKSTPRYVFSLDTGAITWTSKNQHAVALSSIEAKYRGAVCCRPKTHNSPKGFVCNTSKEVLG